MVNITEQAVIIHHRVQCDHIQNLLLLQIVIVKIPP